MKKGTIIMLTILIIIIILAITGGFVFLKINSSPQKIFKTTINKTFNYIQKKQQKYNTKIENFELTGNIESNDEHIEEVNSILSASKVKYNSQLDINNAISHQNFNVTYNGGNFFDADLILQDKKLYIGLQDWFDKYIEISDESGEIKILENLSSMDTNLIIKGIKTELLNVLSNQEFTSDRITMQLDGKDTKVTKSSITLNSKELNNLREELLNNLKGNEDFLLGLGNNKENYINLFDGMINAYKNNKSIKETSTNQELITISIYTKGLLNRFVAIDLVVFNEDTNSEEIGMALINETPNKSQFYIYMNKDGQKEYLMRANSEVLNNSGTIVVNWPGESKEDEENLENEIICKYQKQNDQITFEISTNNKHDNTQVNASGIAKINKKSYSTDILVTISLSKTMKINLNINYILEFDASIPTTDVSNSTTLDNMTEEEKEILTTNFQKSTLYNLVFKRDLNEAYLEDDQYLTGDNDNDFYSNSGIVSNDEFIIKYNFPFEFQSLSTVTEETKTYKDDNENTIKISIEKESDEEYLEKITNNSVLTLPDSVDKNITDILEYEVGEKTFKYRGISYNDGFENYLRLFFTYKLSDENLYVVEAMIKGNSLSLDQLKNFLEIDVLENIYSPSMEITSASNRIIRLLTSIGRITSLL